MSGKNDKQLKTLAVYSELQMSHSGSSPSSAKHHQILNYLQHQLYAEGLK